MKKNSQTFIVSYWQKMWEEHAGDLFIADPYINHLFEQDGIGGKFTSISVADFLYTSQEDLENNANLTQKKYELYTEILARRLNEIHGTSYSLAFWRKCLSCGFMRYIQQFHYMFTVFETYFQDSYSCFILDPSSYYLPRYFEDHRTVFQSTHFGQEQIFSLYMQLFYPGLCPMLSPEPLSGELPEFESHEASVQRQPLLPFLWDKFRQYKLLFFWKAIRKVFFLFARDLSQRDPSVKVGILDSYFADDHATSLQESTSGAIKRVYHGIVSPRTGDCGPDREKRACLERFEQDFDRFDQFFFSTLPYCLPTAYIEDFSSLLAGASRFQAQYPDMTDIVCEAWLSDTADSIVLAYLKEEKGIRHHYNEHNCFFNQFVGNMSKFYADHVDVYVSMGWKDASLGNLTPGASLFPFSCPVQKDKEYDILYVSYPAEGRMSQYASGYAFAGPYAQKYLGFLSTFFECLSLDAVARVSYRGYPQEYAIKGLRYNSEICFSDKRGLIHHISATYAQGQTCKEQMARARLVIIEYSSTAYLEALHMNIPMIFFWDPESKFLAAGHADFYQPLVEAGICQTDPRQAAAFVERIKDDPEGWWTSAFVQERRRAFLEKNFNPPEVMLRYLKNLL